LRAVTSETVQLELKDEQSAGQMRPGGEDDSQYKYVIMPMRI
jgi:DNA polymerase III sliding clamp (beta) subunit (PCNA family)